MNDVGHTGTHPTSRGSELSTEDVPVIGIIQAVEGVVGIGGDSCKNNLLVNIYIHIGYLDSGYTSSGETSDCHP